MDIMVMEPIALQNVAEGDFLHQIKWDGIRGLSVIENGKVSVFSKSGRESTESYPELQSLTDQMDAQQAVLDGEIVVFVDGRPSFYHVLKRSRVHSQVMVSTFPVRYVVFDLLMLNGQDLRQEPIEQRQKLLKSRFAGSASMALADSFHDGKALLDLMKSKSMEGIVSKRRGSLYAAGKAHTDWYKTKTARKMLCAVTGVHFSGGQAASLGLGVYREGQLIPAGYVGTGLSQDDLKRVAEYARREGTKMGDDDFLLEPRLTCWVRFAEWTPTMTLRQPVLLGFSDKPPSEAKGEEIML